jgi:hypothetical protein
MSALAVLAAAGSHSQEAPGTGPGIALIVGAIILMILIAAGIFLVFTRTTKRSRGGVDHPPDDGHPGQPPFESVERRSFPRS